MLASVLAAVLLVTFALALGVAAQTIWPHADELLDPNVARDLLATTWQVEATVLGLTAAVAVFAFQAFMSAGPLAYTGSFVDVARETRITPLLAFGSASLVANALVEAEIGALRPEGATGIAALVCALLATLALPFVFDLLIRFVDPVRLHTRHLGIARSEAGRYRRAVVRRRGQARETLSERLTEELWLLSEEAEEAIREGRTERLRRAVGAYEAYVRGLAEVAGGRAGLDEDDDVVRTLVERVRDHAVAGSRTPVQAVRERSVDMPRRLANLALAAGNASIASALVDTYAEIYDRLRTEQAADTSLVVEFVDRAHKQADAVDPTFATRLRLLAATLGHLAACYSDAETARRASAWLRGTHENGPELPNAALHLELAIAAAAAAHEHPDPAAASTLATLAAELPDPRVVLSALGERRRALDALTASGAWRRTAGPRVLGKRDAEITALQLALRVTSPHGSPPELGRDRWTSENAERLMDELAALLEQPETLRIVVGDEAATRGDRLATSLRIARG